MRIARVIGQVVSVAKPDSLAGRTILLVQEVHPTRPDSDDGAPTAAVDLIGAGRGEIVILATGGAARNDPATEGTPVDAAVIGIVDSLVVDGAMTYEK